LRYEPPRGSAATTQAARQASEGLGLKGLPGWQRCGCRLQAAAAAQAEQLAAWPDTQAPQTAARADAACRGPLDAPLPNPAACQALPLQRHQRLPSSGLANHITRRPSHLVGRAQAVLWARGDDGPEEVLLLRRKSGLQICQELINLMTSFWGCFGGARGRGLLWDEIAPWGGRGSGAAAEGCSAWAVQILPQGGAQVCMRGVRPCASG
jgi:hypothetical protein